MRLAAAFCLAVCLAAHAVVAAPPTLCPQVDDDDLQHGELPHMTAVLKPGGTLNILAVGSATMFEPQASASADLVPSVGAPVQSPSGFPWYMVQALQGAIHGLQANVAVIGGHGQTAEAMLARIRVELAHRKVQLVLWQTGTVDAVDLGEPEDFYQTLADGAAAVAAAGADLVLIDPQYSRFLEANANMAPYLAALQAAGTLPGAAVFNRFDIMHGWAESGSLDLERAAAPDRAAMAVRLHSCLGRMLAKMLLH